MGTVVSIVSAIFAALSVGVLLFFIHKVIWLVRYKSLQRQLMVQASEALQSNQQQALPEWDAFAVAAWQAVHEPRAEGQALQGPAAYVHLVEQELGAMLSACEQPSVSLQALLAEVLQASDQPQTLARVVLELPTPAATPEGQLLTATIQLTAPALQPPAPPPQSLFELDVRSRYGFFRRALVFFAGLADVVYSSAHLAKLSQYSHVPTGTIFRRLSLVVLLVIGIILEVILGMRKKLEGLLDTHVVQGRQWVEGLPGWLKDNMASILALVLWTAAVAVIYFSVYFIIRRRYQGHLKALQQLRDEQQSRLQAIYDKHHGDLLGWADDYGRTLDAAIELTARHITMLAAHFLQRVRQRIAGAELLDQARQLSDALFAQLQDAVTTKKTSFRHALWPRRGEMTDVVVQAQYREAWQYIQLMLNELRLGEPDPDQVASFWRELVVYALSFTDALPDDAVEQLRDAYLRVVEQTSEQSDHDLAQFRRSTNELVGHLNQQLAAATHLLEARVELAGQRMRADSAKFEAEVIRARERARLEAMAFEI